LGCVLVSCSYIPHTLAASLLQELLRYAIHAINIQLRIVTSLEGIWYSCKSFAMDFQGVHNQSLHALALASDTPIIALWATEVLRSLMLEQNLLFFELPVAKEAEGLTTCLRTSS